MKREILIVDDEASTREFFKRVCTDAGYTVIDADGAERALEILLKEKIDVIFLDLKLFGVNGVELCRRIRKLHPLAIINAITGWRALFEIEECREAGFDDYFTKPIDPDMLYKSIAEAFEKLDRWREWYKKI